MTPAEDMRPDAPGDDDEWGSSTRIKPESVGRPRRGMSRAERVRAERNRKRRRRRSVVALTVFIVVVVAAVFLGSRLWHGIFGSGNDYSGDGGSDLVVEVHNGDSTTAIGQTLFDHGVVANVKTFVQAAEGNKAMTEIQPGFYKLRTEISAANAVSRLTEKNNRVGRLVIPEGRQLDDTTDVKTNKINQGIFSLISAASCVDLDGKHKCVSAADLKKAAGAADVSALMVLICSTLRFISSLVEDCCSAAVAMDRAWSAACSTRDTISPRALPEALARAVVSSMAPTV